MSYILGIDPGMGGALAVYNADPLGMVQDIMAKGTAIRVELRDMPLHPDKGIDPQALAQLVARMAQDYPGITAVVENVSSRPRQAGAFAFGLSTGIIHGVLASHGIPFTLVHPSIWKVKMGLGKRPGESYSEGKDRARALATQLFPALASQFTRKKDDGRAEALLLAVYWSTKK